jgi:hypothetical protein
MSAHWHRPLLSGFRTPSHWAWVLRHGLQHPTCFKRKPFSQESYIGAFQRSALLRASGAYIETFIFGHFQRGLKLDSPFFDRCRGTLDKVSSIPHQTWSLCPNSLSCVEDCSDASSSRNVRTQQAKWYNTIDSFTDQLIDHVEEQPWLEMNRSGFWKCNVKPWSDLILPFVPSLEWNCTVHTTWNLVQFPPENVQCLFDRGGRGFLIFFCRTILILFWQKERCHSDDGIRNHVFSRSSGSKESRTQVLLMRTS